MNIKIPNERIIDELEKIGGVKKIALQSPDGLKNEELELSDYLKREGYRTYIHPRAFGACDLSDALAKKIGCDVLIHLGHAPMPVETELPVIFLPAFLDSGDLEKVLEKNIKEIKNLGNVIGLVTTVQHVERLKELEAFLEEHGLEIKVSEGDSRCFYRGQILGCNFSAAHKIEDEVDGFLYVGTGTFHPKGLALSTNKKVLSLEPFGGRLEEINREKLLKQRWGQISMAKEAQEYGVIISTKEGQLRLDECEEIVDKLEENGKKAERIFMDFVDPNHLKNYRNFDAYVTVACPRIPIDNVGKYDKPVLTPKEINSVLFGDGYELDELYGEKSSCCEDRDDIIIID